MTLARARLARSAPQARIFFSDECTAKIDLAAAAAFYPRPSRSKHMASSGTKAVKIDLDFCRRIPKVELHAHINGSISPSTLEKLARRKRATSPDLAETLEAIQAWRESVEKRERRNLAGCFETFHLIHKVVTDAESVTMVTSDVIREFADDGVRYLELRSTLRDNQHTGLTKKLHIEAILKGIEQCEQEGVNIVVKYLPSIDRRMTLEEATNVVNLALDYHCGVDSKVVGVDLSGDPTKGDLEPLVPLLRRAQGCGLKLALHIAEIKDRNEENRMFLQIPPDRIGHGTFLHPEVGGEQALVDKVLEKKIPIEICLTSNVIGATVSCPDEHHLQYWMDRKHPCVICTDDKGVFATSLSEEYLLAATTFDLTAEKLWGLTEGALDCIFGGEEVKQLLKRMWRDQKIKMGL